MIHLLTHVARSWERVESVGLAAAVGSSRVVRRATRATQRFGARHRGVRSWLVFPTSPVRIGKVAIVCAVVCGALVWLYPKIMRPWIFPKYLYTHHRSIAPSVTDSAGRWVGPLPNIYETDVTYSNWPSPDHVSVWPNRIPDGWWQVLKRLEDRHLGGPRSIHGIDIGGLTRAVWGLRSGGHGGGSSLAMMLVRSMNKTAPTGDEPWPIRVRRKALEIRDAPVVFDAIGEEGLRDWCALHIPLVVGDAGSSFGTPVYGIEGSARTIFGKAAADCTLAECALLAAAFFRPFIVVPNAKGWSVDSDRFRRLVERAKHGVAATYGDSGDARAAIAQLDSMPPPHVSIPPAIAELLPRHPEQRFRLVSNPSRRSLWLANGELLEVRSELLAERKDRHMVRAITLNIDTARNHAFKNNVSDVLHSLEHTLADELTLPLFRRRDEQAPFARVLVCVADDRGRIVRLYQNSRASLLDARVPMASLGKIPVAMMLGSLGHRPDQQYCNHAIPGLHNPGNRTGVRACADEGAWLTAEQAYARSWNLPLMWALRDVPKRDLIRLAMDCRIDLPEDVHPATALVLGLADATPRGILQLVSEISSRLRGTAAGGSPSIVSAVADLEADTADGSARSTTLSIAPYFASPSSRSYIRAVLRAPLDLGGTLGRLSDWTPARHPAVEEHWVKTGTAELPEGNIRSVLIAGTIRFKSAAADSRTNPNYSYFVLVCTPRSTYSLGTSSLASHDFAPLVRVIVNDLYDSTQRRKTREAKATQHTKDTAES